MFPWPSTAAYCGDAKAAAASWPPSPTYAPATVSTVFCALLACGRETARRRAKKVIFTRSPCEKSRRQITRVYRKSGFTEQYIYDGRTSSISTFLHTGDERALLCHLWLIDRHNPSSTVAT